MNREFLRSVLNRSSIKQNDPALYQVINELLTTPIEPFQEWQEWAPVPTNLVIGNGKLFGKYIRIDNLVVATLHFQIGSTSSFTGTGAFVSFSLPFPSTTDIDLNLPATFAYGVGTLVAVKGIIVPPAIGIFMIIENNALFPLFVSSPNNQFMDDVSPFPWEDPDTLEGTFIYEAVPL